MGLVYGVGVNNGSCPSRINGAITKEYQLWVSILKLCYSTGRSAAEVVAYKDCVVSDNFKRYDYFYKWCNSQVGFNENGFCLSKNALTKNCKIFSESTSAFIPIKIARLFPSNKTNRGDYLVGVDYSKINNIFRARVSINGKSKFIGNFSNENEAFLLYKKHKEAEIKNIANLNRWKIRPDVYEYLMNYTVDIDD